MATTMNTADYLLMAQEYSIWNATIASLQFWTEDLDPVTLGIATECVYTTFFYTPTSHTLCQQSDETLFGCFIIALNAAFTQQLLLADEGYESGSDAIDLPTPLQKTPCIHHVSSMEHASFNPVTTTTHSTHQHLLDQCTDAYPLALQTATHQTALQYAQTTQMKRKIFRWYPWMMNTGLPKKHLKEPFVYMNMDYFILYANAHVRMNTITLFHTWIVWI